MGKRRSAGQAQRALDPEDVLAGRVKPTLDALLELIHRVNPTGRDRGAAEEQARYAVKARLQSLLVRRFADDLEVEADPQDEGVVSLRRREHARDGCHAVLSALDEDARSWVTFQLDTARAGASLAGDAPPAAARGTSAERRAGRAAPAPASPASRAAARPRETPPAAGAPPTFHEAPPGGAGTPEDEPLDARMRRAMEALDAYDYELARAELEAALGASGGASGPAGALLALLVDTLGADGDAVALDPTLPASTLADAGVRGAIALAAARSGDEALALARARGAEPARAAEIFAALAGRALREGDPERAAAHAAEARRHDPTWSGLARLAEEIAAARAAARAPAEAELARLVEAGDEGAAERRAREVLARWDDSAPARRVLKEIEERRRIEEARRKVQEAEETLAAGDPAVALALFHHALAALPRGPEAAAVEARCAEIEEARRARQAEASAAEACRRLDGPDRAGALLAYLHLDPVARARVRELRPAEELRWLEAAGGHRDRARVDAVLALVQARALLEADPDAAVELLAAHRAALDTVPDARSLAVEAAGRAREARIARARAEVEAARAALSDGEPDQAVERLGDAALRDLPDEERAAAVALRAEAAASAGRQHRIAHVSRLRRGGRLFEARAAAEALAACEPEEDRARWLGERDAVTAQIQEHFRVEVDEAPRPLSALGQPRTLAGSDEVPCALTGDGRALVLAEAHDRAVLVRLWDIAEARVRATAALLTPDALGRPSVHVEDDELWLVGDTGALLRLRWTDWTVLAFASPESLGLGRVVLVERAALGPAAASGHRSLWVVVRTAGMGSKLCVVDLERSRIVREVADAWSLAPLPGLDEPRFVCLHDSAATLLDARGAPVAGGRLAAGARVTAAALHPSGKGIVTLLASDGVWDEVSPLHLQEIPFTSRGAFGAPSGKILLERSDGEAPHAIGSSRDAGIVAVTFHGPGPELMVLAPGEGGALAPIHRGPAPAQAALVQDARGRRLCVVCPEDDGLCVVELGAAPPVLPDAPPEAWAALGTLLDLHLCGRPGGARWDRILTLVRSVEGLDAPALGRWIRDRRERFADRPLDLLDTFYALELGAPHAPNEVEGYAIGLIMHAQEHPEVQLLHAHRFAVDREWDVALRQAAAIDASALEPALRKHLHHVTALAAAYTGRSEAAREALERAAMEEGNCAMGLLEVLLDPGERPVPDEWRPAADLARAARVADERRAAGDLPGVVEALDTEPVRRAGEVQTLARLAEAYLAVTPPDAPGRFRRLAALGRFLDADARSSLLRRDLPLGGERWEGERIAELRERIRAALGAL